MSRQAAISARHRHRSAEKRLRIRAGLRIKLEGEIFSCHFSGVGSPSAFTGTVMHVLDGIRDWAIHKETGEQYVCVYAHSTGSPKSLHDRNALYLFSN